MMTTPAPIRNYLPALDGLRGIAILLVILTHASSGWGAALSIYPGPASAALPTLPGWLAKIASNASHGVQLFFVVSAFMLTIRSGDRVSNLASFAVRRLARIGPAYWVAAIFYSVIGGLAVARAFAPHGISGIDLFVAIIFAQAWQGQAAMAVVPGGWSVSCEASFYVVLPFLLRLFDGRIWRAALSMSLVTLAACIIARDLMLANKWTFQAYANPLMQAPVFLIGILAAIIFQKTKVRKMPVTSVIALAFGIFIWPFSPIKDHQVLLHVSFAAIMAFVVVLAAADENNPLGNAVMRKVGEVSYSMYLIHFVVLAPSMIVVQWLTRLNDWLTVALHFSITATLSFGLAWLSYRYIERPAIDWASRWTREFLSKSSSLPSA